MRVELRRGQGGVAEQLLHRPQVGAALEQVGGGGVAQPVRADVGRARDLGDAPVHQRAHRALVDPPAAGAEEERRPGSVDEQGRASRASQRSARARPGGRTAPMRSLRPLPSTRTTLRSRSTSSRSSPTSSPTRMPGRVEQLEHRHVAQPDRRSRRRPAPRPPGSGRGPRRRAAPAGGGGGPRAEPRLAPASQSSGRCGPATR